MRFARHLRRSARLAGGFNARRRRLIMAGIGVPAQAALVPWAMLGCSEDSGTTIAKSTPAPVAVYSAPAGAPDVTGKVPSLGWALRTNRMNWMGDFLDLAKIPLREHEPDADLPAPPERSAGRELGSQTPRARLLGLRAGTIAGREGTKPSLSCQMDGTGWSGLGCHSDFFASMKLPNGEPDFKRMIDWIHAGGLGSFRRDEIVGYDMYALLYWLLGGSQELVRQGQPLLNKLAAFFGDAVVKNPTKPPATPEVAENEPKLSAYIERVPSSCARRMPMAIRCAPRRISPSGSSSTRRRRAR